MNTTKAIELLDALREAVETHDPGVGTLDQLTALRTMTWMNDVCPAPVRRGAQVVHYSWFEMTEGSHRGARYHVLRWLLEQWQSSLSSFGRRDALRARMVLWIAYGEE